MSAISDVVTGNIASQAPVSETNEASKKTKVSGKTVGNPQLSEKAAKYYEELKKKYSNMDFILVSKDQKAAAQAQAGKYANPAKMVVLIDEEKIEKMAEDENYRKQYESVIANAKNGLSQMKSKLEATGAKVKGYGMQVKDNGASSFFAVMDKSFTAQRKRMAQRAEKKAAEKKAAEKKANKEEQQERLEKSREHRAEDTDVSRTGRPGRPSGKEDEVVITASSIDELIRKVNDYIYGGMSDWVETESERNVGHNFDFSI